MYSECEHPSKLKVQQNIMWNFLQKKYPYMKYPDTNENPKFSTLTARTPVTSHSRSVAGPTKHPSHAYIVGKLSIRAFHRCRLTVVFRFQFVKIVAKRRLTALYLIQYHVHQGSNRKDIGRTADRELPRAEGFPSRGRWLVFYNFDHYRLDTRSGENHKQLIFQFMCAGACCVCCCSHPVERTLP